MFTTSPGSHAFALGRPSAERDQGLAGRDADSHLEVALLTDPVADRERRANRPLGIVLVSGRRAEERHHRVADELLDRPAAPLELRAQPRVVRLEHGAHVLGVELLGPRREADEVGEEDGHDLALLPGRLGGVLQPVPQLEQKRAPSSFSWPQLGQMSISAAGRRGIRAAASRR